MAVLFFLSTDHFSAQHTGSFLKNLIHHWIPGIPDPLANTLHGLLRKAAHFCVYAVLALLLVRAFRFGNAGPWRARWAVGAGIIVSLYALADEWHQAFTSARGASIYDSLLDTAGGLFAIACLWIYRRSRFRTKDSAQ
jgi:VanZ family protein